MEAEAKQLISEANRMKKEAASMDPNVVAKEANLPSVAVEAPKRRGRGPNKPKTVVADAQ